MSAFAKTFVGVLTTATSAAAPPGPLPPDFLLKSADDIAVTRIDFGNSPIPGYKGLYAAILDNVLSRSECQAFVHAAEATTSGTWEQALSNISGGYQYLNLETRNSRRIIWYDAKIAGRILDRVRPHLPELEVLEDNPAITGR